MSLVRWQPRGGLRRWTPYPDLEEIPQEMNRLFDWAFGRQGGENMLPSVWVPAMDVFQDDDRFRIRVDLPGMKRDAIEITMNGDTLTITGEKKQEDEVKEDSHYHLERNYGKFSRSLSLPTAVNGDKIEASYKDGVLEIVVPKSEAARPKQVKIQ